MQNTSNRIEFNFTYYAMKLLGKNLYSSPWTAISELVANGIDAGASEVYVYVNMTNKEHSVVEIFDNGNGMSYSDLADKYVLIGRNKRLSDENNQGKTLGRKGIGKLAALYLSPKYVISTKTISEHSNWMIDTSKFKDSDIPTLSRISDSDFHCEANSQWKQCQTGTLIHLSDVDLRKIGTEKIKKLNSILSEYYLKSQIDCKIFVCIVDEMQKNILFSEINRKYDFETMYAVFDNTGFCKGKLNKTVYLTDEKSIPEVDYPRNTIELQNIENCNGKLKLKGIDGNDIETEYNLYGWIGIHTSLRKDVLLRNVMDKDAYILTPNKLRLYVRGKLAVDDLMGYLKITQAFSNYIEGDISFDVLDDDRFEDASTSSREGYTLSDPRIEKLLEIVRKICVSLINERVKIGSTINEEIKAHNEETLKKQKEATLKAETERDDAIEQSIQAKHESETERKRSNYIVSVSNIDENNVLPAMHTVYNLAIEQKKKLAKCQKYWQSIPNKVKSNLEVLGEANNQIICISKGIAKSNYLVESEETDIDIFEYIKEYVNNVARKIYGNKISLIIKNDSDKEIIENASTLKLATVIENIIGNSIKSKSTELVITHKEVDQKHWILFTDNGNGLDPSIPNIERMFDFGFTTTNGAGLGLYYSKAYIEEMNGKMFGITNEKKGITIIIEW